MKNVEDILVSRTLNVMRLFRLRSRYIAVQEKVCVILKFSAIITMPLNISPVHVKSMRHSSDDLLSLCLCKQLGHLKFNLYHVIKSNGWVMFVLRAYHCAI